MTTEEDQHPEAPRSLQQAEGWNRFLPSGTLILGMALGAALCVLIYFFIKIELTWYILGALGALSLGLFVGAFLTQYWYRRQLHLNPSQTQHYLQTTQTTAQQLLLQFLALRQAKNQDPQETAQALGETLTPMLPIAKRGLQLGLAFMARVWAFGAFIAVMTVMVSVAICLVTYMQVERLDVQNRRLDQQTYLQEAERRSALVFLFSNVMDAIDKELKDDYGKDSIRNLSPQLIGRIIALSNRLKPYQYLQGDTLIGRPLSPERGQLLVNLVESQLDALTYQSIFKKASFQAADLFGADLSEAYLQGADLRGADLSEAYLRGAYLRGAVLTEADLRRAVLTEADLAEADLSEAVLAEADLSEAVLIQANLSEADLRRAVLRKAVLSEAFLNGTYLSDAHLQGAYLQGAYLQGAHLQGAHLQGAHLQGAHLQRAHLQGAYLQGAYLIRAYLQGAHLNGAYLQGAHLRRAHLNGVHLNGAHLNETKVSDTLFFQTLIQPNAIVIEDLQQKYQVNPTPKYHPRDVNKKSPYYLIEPKPTPPPH